MKKRIFATLLVLALALALFPVVSSAANYDLYIGCVRVTSNNASNITGTGISGSVSYDHATKTLTLNNATITEVYDSSRDMYCVYSYSFGVPLTVHLIGQNTITSKDLPRDDGSTYGIYGRGTLTFSGSGSLTVKAGDANGASSNNWSVGIFASDNITIGENCTITASCGVGDTTAAIMSYDDLIIPEDMTIIASRSASGTPTVEFKASTHDAYNYLKISPTVYYTVAFDANGGAGSMASASVIAGNYTLPECGFTAPQGKKFKAWKVNGAEKNVGDQITVSQNVTLTAVWENLPPVHTCSPKAVAKVPASCTAEGKEAYYKCEGCGKFFSDAQGKNVISNITTWGILKKTDHVSHWKECTAANCGASIENSRAAHADGNGDGKCDTCQYTMPVVSTDSSDNSNLNTETNNGDQPTDTQSDVSVSDTGSDATTDTDNEQTGSDIAPGTDNTPAPTPGTDNTPDANGSDAPTETPDDAEKANLTWLWIVLGAVVVLAGAGAGVFFFLKKKSGK